MITVTLCMKILVVHRQKEVIEKIKSVLRTNNSIIRFSDSGLSGLLAARIEWFDLIICGTELPVITGFEMIRSLRTSSVNKSTPVIFIASEITEKIKHLGYALGAIELLNLSDMETKLSRVVNENIIETPDNKWEDLLLNLRMN